MPRAGSRATRCCSRPNAPHARRSLLLAMAKGDPPRVRDLPAPRRSESAIGPLFRTVFKWPYRVGLAGLYRAGLRPWQLTFLSLATNGLIGWLLVTGERFVPGLLLILAGLLDIFD